MSDVEVKAQERASERLAAFQSFARNLFDVDEPSEDWRNRLGWAWERLTEFAELQGPEYLKVVESHHFAGKRERAALPQ